MIFEVEGLVSQLQQEVTGNGKNGAWKKQEIIIETQEQYPKKLCFSAWGDKVDMITNLSSGTKIKVLFSAESREFNGRWYTDLRIWKAEPAQSGGVATGAPAAAPISENDLPGIPDGDGDMNDLPF